MRMLFSFDVDGTLLNARNEPRNEIIAILLALQEAGHRIRVISGGGEAYARQVVGRLSLDAFVHEFGDKIGASKYSTPDVHFDDCETSLAHHDIRV